MLRIDQDDGHILFEQVEHRFPEHTSRFHCDVRDLESLEPISEGEEIHRHGRKRPDVLLHFPRG